ncbi:hypothetical protein EON68_02385, partial [archaeon]
MAAVDAAGDSHAPHAAGVDASVVSTISAPPHAMGASSTLAAGSDGMGAASFVVASVTDVDADRRRTRVSSLSALLALDYDAHSAPFVELPHGLRIFTGTWNMAEVEPPAAWCHAFIPRNVDIVALSIQECMHTDAILAAVRSHLGGGWLEIEHRVGSTMKGLGFHGHISCAVWVRDWLVTSGMCKLSKAVRGSVPLGMNLFVTRASNKGAVAISIPLRLPDAQGALTVSSSLVFVSCHLAADHKGSSRLPDRVKQFKYVSSVLNLGLPHAVVERACAQVAEAGISFDLPSSVRKRVEALLAARTSAHGAAHAPPTRAGTRASFSRTPPRTSMDADAADGATGLVRDSFTSLGSFDAILGDGDDAVLGTAFSVPQLHVASASSGGAGGGGADALPRRHRSVAETRAHRPSLLMSPPTAAAQRGTSPTPTNPLLRGGASSAVSFAPLPPGGAGVVEGSSRAASSQRSASFASGVASTPAARLGDDIDRRTDAS